MTHLSIDELVLDIYGEPVPPDAAEHLRGCAQCRQRAESLREMLDAVDLPPVPERGPGYGREVWARIEPRLDVRPERSWFRLVRWWALAAAMASLLTAAFLAGRWSQPPVMTAGSVRERVLLVAVGDHLERSQAVLLEIVNAATDEPAGKSVDFSGQQEAAQDLVETNRLFRQTAVSTGETGVASLLEELERVLLEVAHSPSELTGDQLRSLQERLEEQGMVFKVRVLGGQIRQRERNGL